MKKSKNKGKVILFALLVLALFAVVAAKTAKDTFSDLKAGESFSEVDYYSMQKYSDQNSEAVFSALKSGKPDKLSKLLQSSEGADAVMEFADWSEADFKNAVGLGAGSLSSGPDDDGRIDISERYFVDVGEEKYVVMVETVTSRWGRTNDGISSVAVTTYSHFDSDLDWDWLGEADDYSALAGELFWIENFEESENEQEEQEEQ